MTRELYRHNANQVFFETIRPGDRARVTRYLREGRQVRVFDFTYRLKSIGWLRPLLLEGRVERIYIHINSRADGLAIEAAERLFPRWAGHPLVRALAGVYGEAEAHPVLKSILTEQVSRYLFTRLYLEEKEKSWEGEGLLVPSSYEKWDRLLGEWCRGRGMRPLQRVQLLRRWGFAGEGRLRALAVYLSTLGLLAAHAAARLAGAWKGAAPVRARHLYGVNHRFQTKFRGGRRYDFLADGDAIRKDELAFLVEPAGQGPWEEEARRAGYRVLRWADAAGFRGALRSPARGIPAAAVIRCAAAGWLRPGAPGWIHEGVSSGLWALVNEMGMLERMEFENYIYPNQAGLRPRWRNAMVRRRGGESWCFAYSTGGGFMYREDGPFAGGSDFGSPHRFWAFQNPDHFVSPCPQLIGYHRRHRQVVGQYHDVGNLWADQILLEERRAGREGLRREILGDPLPGRKVVAWFDTTFVAAPNSPSTFEEAVRWYGDILRLAEERPDLHMVIKPSKDAGYYVSDGADRQWALPAEGRKLMAVWDKLKGNPRVHFLGNEADPSSVAAASDLTVTFCFSSVSSEALAAGKRAIWYEPGQRWRDTLLGSEPLLVAHGYEELRAIVRRLVDEMTEAEYGRFLDSTVREKVDSFVDGKGLARFRDLLAGVAAAERTVTEAAWVFSTRQ